MSDAGTASNYATAGAQGATINAQIPGWEIAALQQLAANNRLSGVPPDVLAAIVQAESSGQGGSINSAGYGGWFGLGQNSTYPTGASSAGLLSDPSQASFEAQAQLAAGEFASLLQAANGDVYTAEGYYQQGQGGYTPGQITEGIRVMQQLGVAQTVNGAAPAGSVSYTGSGTAGGTGSTDLSGSAIPKPPGMGDIPGLVAYIKQYFGADAWLLDLPGTQGSQVAQIIEDAVAQGYGNDSAYIQGKLSQTPWFQQTSQAYQTYLANKSSNPGDYSFTVPGSKASQAYSSIMAQAAQSGVTISSLEAQQLATMSLEYGWTTPQVNAALGDTVYYKGNQPGQTNAGSVISQLQAQNANYLQNPSAPVMQSWAQNIAAGTQTMTQYEAYLKQNASLKWTGMAGQIQQGYTPNQIVDNMRNSAANLMEVDPSSIDFVNNPLYSKMLDYVPPDSPNGVHRVMTEAEANSYLMGTPQWSTTLNARNAVATLADQITTTFGRAP